MADFLREPSAEKEEALPLPLADGEVKRKSACLVCKCFVFLHICLLTWMVRVVCMVSKSKAIGTPCSTNYSVFLTTVLFLLQGFLVV